MNSLPRFLIDKHKIHRGKFSIYDRDETKKIRQVLRLEAGDQIRIFDGYDREYIAEITQLKKEEIKGKLISEIEVEIDSNPKPEIVLAQALSRTTKIDQIIKINTEIGVKGFILFESDHSVVKLKDLKEKKLARWEKISLESVRHSEQKSIPQIHESVDFKELLEFDADIKLLLHSRNLEESININEFSREALSGKKVLVIIGPEGGFSERELQTIIESNIKICHMDLPILRTETAGIVVGSHLLLKN